MKEQLIAYYIEYLNDYLTIEHMAEHYGFSIKDTNVLVNLGRKYYDESRELHD